VSFFCGMFEDHTSRERERERERERADSRLSPVWRTTRRVEDVCVHLEVMFSRSSTFVSSRAGLETNVRKERKEKASA